MMCSGVVLLSRPPEGMCEDKIEIGSSTLHGNGVFLKKNEVITAGEVVCRYPGRFRWVNRPPRASEGLGHYVYALGPFILDDDPGVQKYAIVDAGSTTANRAIGHILNTSHPTLRPPFNRPNCVFAVYFKDLVFRSSLPPPLVLYVQCAVSLPANSQTRELLLDYHWALVWSDNGKWCGDPQCVSCVDDMLAYFTYLHSSLH